MVCTIDTRMQLRIGIYYGHSLVSQMIQWQSWAPQSHASLISPSGTVFESVWRHGVVQHPDIADYHKPKTGIEIYRVDHDPDLTTDIISWAVNEVGKKYDWRGVLGFVSRRDGAQRQQRWFCSEFVFAAFAQAGVLLLERTEAHKVRPSDLAKSPLLTWEKCLITGSAFKGPESPEKRSQNEAHRPT